MRCVLLWALVLDLVAFACGADKKEVAQLHPAELAHKRHFWSIGEGFEGSASDWTEYFVWGIGVIGVFYYMSNPNARQNLHAVRDDDEGEHRFERDERELDDVFDVASEDHKKEQ